MSHPGNRSSRALLAVSLFVNVLFLVGGAVLVLRRGGVPYVKAKLGLSPRQFETRPFQAEKIEVFRALPNGRAEIVFAGDSFAASAPVLDAYTPLRNRGIGGDTTSGLLSRLDEITEGRPERIFLQVGANDVANLVPVGETVENYRTILRRIRGESPDTLVFVMSVPPTTPELLDSATRRNPVILKLNAELRRLAAAEGATFVDLTPWLQNEQGNLRRDFATEDGIHLNTAGHLVVCELLRPYVPTLCATRAQKP